MKTMVTLLVGFFSMLNLACNPQPILDVDDALDPSYAKVKKVLVSGSERNYTFSVTLESPDKGCSQYANWWEVITENEALVYRRILGHSHVNEQPFTRSGGPVEISATDVVIIRGHMNITGYGEGEIAMKGSIEFGFELFLIDEEFGKELETVAPQPATCAF